MMSRAVLARIPVTEAVKNQTVLTMEKDSEGNFNKGQQKVKVEQFPTEEVDFVLTLTEELSCVSTLRQCHCTFKNTCNCRNLASRNNMAYLKLDLTFENYLHSMSQDYKYKITCNMTDRLGRQQQMCSFEEVRTLRSMTFLIGTNHRLGCIIDDLKESLVSVVIERSCIKPDLSKKLQSDFQALLDNPVHSDVTLIVDSEVDKVSFKAHKSILSCRSEVFRGMFGCQMTENQTGIVNIKDVSAETMKELLRYIYTGRAENLGGITVDLFEAAAKYQIEDLKSECIEYFIFNVNLENIVNFSKLCDMYGVQELRENISIFMKKYKGIVRNN